MRIKSVLAITLAAALLVGCGAAVHVVKIDTLPSEQKDAVSSVKIYNNFQLMFKDFEVLSLVEGNACRNKFNDPPATRTSAIEQLKYFANELGANGIANVQCQSRGNTVLTNGCWELISCTAEAIKVIRGT